ncbi:MAG: EamA family transporter [Rhodobacteraceae bacterium]|nr:EamA family transporter [Paracoccaceae bacterium]
MDMRALLMGLSFVLMWSSAFTSARIAVAYASPLLLLSVRFLISGLLAMAIAKLLGQRIALTRKQWLAVALFGLLQNGVYLGANFVAMQWIEAGLAAIIASLLPLLVALLSWVFFKERLPKLGVLGLFAGLAGVLIIMWSRLSGGADIIGVALAFMGVGALSIATLLVRGAASSGNVLMVVGLQMLVASAALFPASLAFETWHVVWTWQLIAAFTYTTLVPGVLATLVWFLLVNRIGAIRASSFHFLNPFLGVAIAAVFVGESLSMQDIVGVMVITAGIVAVQLSKR